MIFPRNHKFFEIFDLKTQQLFTGGIFLHHAENYKKYWDPNYYKRPELLTKDYLENIYPAKFTDGPKVLTMADHLEAGFVIWILSISFAFVVFIIEWIIRLKDYLVCKVVLGAFYKLRIF